MALDVRGNDGFVFHQISVKLFHLSLLRFSLAFYNKAKEAMFGTCISFYQIVAVLKCFWRLSLFVW